MSSFHKTLLVIIALAYLISPLDLIPDLFIPWVGWVDDAFIVGMIFYYLRNGTLPAFFSWPGMGRKKPFDQERSRDFGNDKKTDSTGNGKTDYTTRQAPRQTESRTRKKTPHEILGVTPGASREEIRSAYRKAVKEYHPDRVAHLGKDLQALAHQRFIEIKDAYNYLKKS